MNEIVGKIIIANIELAPGDVELSDDHMFRLNAKHAASDNIMVGELLLVVGLQKSPYKMLTSVICLTQSCQLVWLNYSGHPSFINFRSMN